MPEGTTSTASSSPGSLRAALLRLLRVPPEPRPPFGASGVVRTFRASPRFYYYRVARWLMGQLTALSGLLGAFAFLRYAPALNIPANVVKLLRFGEVLAWVGFLAQLPFTFALIKLDFELRWYIVTDRSLRIREGILHVVEKTMTYANIQNLAIRQGPLQRILRIHDLEVKTAGGGAASQKDPYGGKMGDDLHTAYFRGVDNAAEIRMLILDRVRRHRDAGLGDPDDVYAATHDAADATFADHDAWPAGAPVQLTDPSASQPVPAGLPADAEPAPDAPTGIAALRAAAHDLLHEARTLRRTVITRRA